CCSLSGYPHHHSPLVVSFPLRLCSPHLPSPSPTPVQPIYRELKDFPSCMAWRPGPPWSTQHGSHSSLFPLFPSPPTPVQPIYRELKDSPSCIAPAATMERAAGLAQVICTVLYGTTALFAYLLFGDSTAADVLANYDQDLGLSQVSAGKRVG
ncbi:unnamed protein product, partial [Closterium sp. NIES-54]